MRGEIVSRPRRRGPENSSSIPRINPICYWHSLRRATQTPVPRSICQQMEPAIWDHSLMSAWQSDWIYFQMDQSISQDRETTRSRIRWMAIATICFTAGATLTASGAFLLTIPFVLGVIAELRSPRRGRWLMWVGAAYLSVTLLQMEIRILPEGGLAGCGKTRFEADAVPRNSLVSTAQPDKKKVCVEKTSNSWMCSAM